MMTNLEKQQLSRDVAEKYNIKPYVLTPTLVTLDVLIDDEHHPKLWLHEDSARCFDLMVEHDIEIEPNNNGACSVYFVDYIRRRHSFDELHSAHSTKQEATRIAILKALLAKEVE